MRVGIAAMTILVLVLAGCTESTSDSPPGPESLPADQLYAQALANAVAQPSFRLSESGADIGRVETLSDGTRSLITIDLNGDVGEVRRIGLDVMVRGSAHFFDTVYPGPAGPELFAAAGPDRWVLHQTTDPRYSAVKRWFNLQILLQLFAPMTRDEPHDGTVTLRDATGNTLLVSLAGDPLPTHVVRFGISGDLTYGEPVAVTAPDPAEVVPAPAVRRP